MTYYHQLFFAYDDPMVNAAGVFDLHSNWFFSPLKPFPYIHMCKILSPLCPPDRFSSFTAEQLIGMNFLMIILNIIIS